MQSGVKGEERGGQTKQGRGVPAPDGQLLETCVQQTRRTQSRPRALPGLTEHPAAIVRNTPVPSYHQGTICILILPVDPHSLLPFFSFSTAQHPGSGTASIRHVSLVTFTLWNIPTAFFFFFFFFFKGFSFIYLFIYLFYFWLCWVFGSCEGPLQLRQAGATLHRGAGTALHRGARALHHRGPPHRGAQAPDAQAQQLWLTGPAAPRHAGSSQTRARTRVPCTSRQILNHCATREAPNSFLKNLL